ncbi:hypothetical protein OU995_04890 [Roseateles sp. SL47]|uniref:hypothetical protein n=1 Tax=Roseateles sp. SL47 TaxID=2995138 RepID=UPI00227085E0|nr:hypothetical protein [Roseateles sp. SL47]WAC74070.1 hypothetical protein OU995_04890 [Roseateles sp. SL47]
MQASIALQHVVNATHPPVIYIVTYMVSHTVTHIQQRPTVQFMPAAAEVNTT